MKKKFALGLMTVTLISCNGSGGGGSSSPQKITSSLNDTTLISFQQTSGMAKSSTFFWDTLIAKAYAATGDISCYTGQNVSFDMDIKLGSSTENLQIEASCGQDIELKIRQSMLEALDGHGLVREKGQSPTGIGYWLDFSVDGFEFDKPYTIKEKVGWAGIAPNATHNTCYLDYTFNHSTGTVNTDTVAPNFPSARFLNSAVNDNYSITNPNTPSSDNNYVGCNTAGVKAVSGDFRFKNGKIEIDESGKKLFSINGCALFDEDTGALLDYKENGDGNSSCPDIGYDSTYERFCIDDNADGNCDTI